MASDVEIVLQTLPRIHFALRTRGVSDPERGVEVSEHQARILGLLDEDDPAMVTELAEVMGVTASTMSLNLKRLEEGGWITRDRDPADRRVMNVRLSPAGARIREGLGELDVARVDALLRTLGREERRVAVQGLVALAEAADALRARGGAASWSADSDQEGA
ncbi:MAG TPA: MarR family transcriptional regulator [Longimicrobiales bacterium]|nr:MarR family transcriptional regulator [Longimicrobiales bacterium]